MKVPVVARTGQSHTGLGYLKAVTPNFSGVQQGLNSLEAAVGAFGARVRAREEDTNKLKTLAAYSAFETEMNVKLSEMKRSAPADGMNFVPQAMAEVDSLQNKFIAEQVPPEFQEEFTTRAAQLRSRAELDAYQFQFTQQDAYFNTQITAEYEKAKVALAQNPGAFDEWSERLADFIDNADIPEGSTDSQGNGVNKTDMRRTMRNGLAAIVYGKEVEGIRRDVGATDFADKLINIESGGSATAKNPNSSATGAGQFIESTWQQFISEEHPELVAQGDIQKLRNDPELSREAVNWYAGKNSQVLIEAGQAVTEGNLYLAHFAGPQGALKLLAAPADATAESVLGSAVVNANPFLKNMTASDVIAWAAKKMGDSDAIAALDEDPMFSELTLEDREAMIHDADTRVTQEEQEREKAEDAARAAAQNQLYVSLLDHTAGQVDIDAARKSGLLTDVDDIEKAQAFLKQQEVALAGRSLIQSMIDGNGAYNSTLNTDDYNNWFGQEGANAVNSGDQGFINGTVLPAAQKLLDVPPAFVSQLETMTRAADSQQMRFGYENLAGLEDSAPDAYAARVNADLAARVDDYRYMRTNAQGEELENWLRRGRNPAEVQVSKALDGEAAELLKDMNVTNIVTNTRLFPFRFDPGVGNWTAVRVQLEKEFVSAFKFNYRVTGEESAAQAAALKQLRRVGQETTIGNGKRLMKYPIDNPISGYPALEEAGFMSTGYEGYEDQIRKDLNILDQENFELVADEQTIEEVKAYKAGQLNRLPSYGVIRITEDEVPIPEAKRWYGDATARPE